MLTKLSLGCGKNKSNYFGGKTRPPPARHRRQVSKKFASEKEAGEKGGERGRKLLFLHSTNTEGKVVAGLNQRTTRGEFASPPESKSRLWEERERDEQINNARQHFLTTRR